MVDINSEVASEKVQLKKEKKKMKKVDKGNIVEKNVLADGGSLNSEKKKKKRKSDVDAESPKPKKVKSVEQSSDTEGKENKKKEKLKKKIVDKKKQAKDPKKEDKEPAEKLTKKEERTKQKQLKAERKAKKITTEGVFDIALKAKKVWEEVRREDCPDEKKATLLKELHGLVKGNVEKIIFAHDTVRVIECLMALGSPEIRDDMFQEVKDDILKMSQSKYANFFVQKLLKYGTKEQKALIFKKFDGNVAKLMKHKTAGFVVELAYNDYANAAQKNSMLQEFLGPEYRLFKEPECRTVLEIIGKHPEKKDELVKQLAVNVDVLVQKGTYNHSLVHSVIYNYLSVAPPAKRAECIETLRDALIHMIHSRDGAMAGLLAVWHGTAKDRKAIIKSFKTHVTKIAMEEYGHLILLGIFDSVDDTKLVGKAILSEIGENIEEIATNKYGVRVLKYLMAGRNPVYTFPDALKLLQQGDGNEHSKKDTAIRHSELVSTASSSVLSWVSANLTAGIYDPPTTITFTAFINNAAPSQHRSSLYSLLAEEASKPFMQGDEQPNIVENSASHMLLKKVIQKDKERAGRGEDTFSGILSCTVDADGVESWLSCNRGAFLLVAMLETEIEEVVRVVKKRLPFRVRFSKKQKTKGAEVLRKKLNL